MTSVERYEALNTPLSPWLDVVHQLPLQLDDYISFLQEHSDTILFKPPPEKYEFISIPKSAYFDDDDIEEQQQQRQQQEEEGSLSTILDMSNHQQTSFHSQSYSSSTFSSSSNGEAPKTWRKTESAETNPSGTTVRRTSEQPGQAATEQTLRYDSSGKAVDQPTDAGRIEDATDADREYLEKMEDEYAKREGGA